MAKIRHIAITTDNPAEVGAFFEEAFEMTQVRKSDNGAVFLSDGYMNLAILNHKTNKDADVGQNGPNYNGIHHIGFLVDDLEEAGKRLEGVKGKALGERDGLEVSLGEAPRNYEQKWAGPHDMVIDVSHTGWLTS
jgi:catechol 2,3-dioxygenase-like lactoylglutathione lyase family enzyme